MTCALRTNGVTRTSFVWEGLTKQKRDFESVNFYYDINALNADVTNIYDTNGYLNQENIANGTIKPISTHNPVTTITPAWMYGQGLPK